MITVLFVSKGSDKNGYGANLLEASQSGKMTKQRQPTTTMAMMLTLCHPCLAVATKVSGIRINEIAADRRSRPITSSSNHKLFAPPVKLWPFHGNGGRALNLAAFLMFRSKARARGKKATGSTMVQMPYPHLHVVWESRLVARGAPAQTVIKKGISGKLENKARFNKSLVSAMKICWRMRRPVAPAE